MSQSTEEERMQLALERLQCAVEEPSITVRSGLGGPIVAQKRSHTAAFPVLAPSAKLALPRSSALKCARKGDVVGSARDGRSPG